MQMTTRSAARSIIVATLTALVALILGVTQTLTTAITASLGLTAVRALIVPGTGTPDPSVPQDYMANAVKNYLIPGGVCDDTCFDDGSPVPVKYIAQFWPIPLPGWGGLQGAKWNVSVASGVESLNGQDPQNLGAYPQQRADFPDDDITIFGYSQGATVASIVKGQLANIDQSEKDKLNFFFIGNPQRPSGGVFERLAFLGTVPVLDATFGNPTPTNTCEHSNGDPCATDFALQYDGVVDSPQWLLNPLALGNALAGFAYVHGTYLSPDDGEAQTERPYGYSVQEVQDAIAAAETNCDETTYCQHVDGSDTIYITLPARTLPLYQPALDLGSATGTSILVVPIVDLLQPATQTLIETAYDRSDYSKPQPGTLLPPASFNPIQTGVELVNDIPEGINNALTPGLQPLPGSDPNSNVVETDNQTVMTTTVADDKPSTRLSLFAKPNEGIATAGTGGTSSTGPVGNALKDFHPVRDTAKAFTGAVKKVLGKDDRDGKSDTAN